MKPKTVPTLEGADPIVGHQAQLMRDRFGVVQRLGRHPSPLVRLRSPFADVVVVTGPELLQEVLVDKPKSFEKAPVLKFVLYPLAGEGLFTSDGELWRRQRRVMAPMFHPGQLEAYADDMVACAEHDIASWRDGDTVELARETTRIAMSVAGKTLFNADTFSEADELGHALTVALSWANANNGSPLTVAHLKSASYLLRLAERAPSSLAPVLRRAAGRLRSPLFVPGEGGRRLREAVGVLDRRVARMIDDRRREGLTRADLLTRLLSAKDEENGATMSDKQVRDEVLTLFVAGHETTATALAWTVHLLCEHPAVYEAVQREVDALGHRPGLADLARLPLCLRVFKEALRLYPPVYLVGRIAVTDVTIGGFEIPANTLCLLSPYATHHRQETWPEPEAFDPDRFLPAREAGRHKLAFLPFGAGPRVCIGNHFALMEAQLVMATVLSRFRFEPLSREVPATFATLRPLGGMPMRVRSR